ncbi:MAG: ABC transporter ATP-binding protein [Bryobacteraceae bacterium]|nr:ABC transporter ATP-binding protein [Bryobacteraceae bacterium]
MSLAIRFSNVHKRFRRTRVLDGLDMDVPQGAIYALVGANGAGKTTSIRVLMNILRADSGSAEVLGTDSRRLGPDHFRTIGHVSENQEMPEWMTVGYFLEYLKPFYPTWDDAWATELIRRFRLPLDRRLKDLSRGMKMKAALASSLAFHPKLLVLDEPFGGLDPIVREDLVEGLLECAGDNAMTILISSHDLAEIESFASHVGYLDEGRLQFSEELATLSARFREVEVTLPEAPTTPPPTQTWPEAWIRESNEPPPLCGS